MKINLMTTGFAFLLTTTGMKAQAQSAQPQIDFTAVNGVIQEVITSSVKLDNVIKGVTLVIDPSSNLPQGKIDAKFAAAAGMTPWDKTQDSQISLQVGSRFKDVNTLSKEGALKLKVQAKTPVLEMIRYFAAKEIEHASPQYPHFYDATIKKLSEVKDIAELYEIAVELKQLLIENADNQEEKEFIQSLRFTAKTVDGVVESFKVEETKPLVLNFAGNIEIRMAAITINPKSMGAGFILATTMDTTMFNQYVEKSTAFFAELQGRNVQYLDYIKDTVSDYMDLVRDFLNQ
ncbi:MAG TPA: hypothetical protein VIG33_07480 [Pseudobdellovibrionaceae bacterium]